MLRTRATSRGSTYFWQSKSAERETLCPSKRARDGRQHIRTLDEPVTMMDAWKRVFDIVERALTELADDAT